MKSIDTSDPAEQLELLIQVQASASTAYLMGGVAEDALLHGRLTRAHGDLDFMVERTNLEGLLAQLRAFGYDSWLTKGENAADEPFYLANADSPVPIELGIADRSEGGDLFFEIARVDFKLATGPAPVGYRVYLPADTFKHAPTKLEDSYVRCISPLANYQLRVGIASRGTFGDLRESDNTATAGLRAQFFPDLDGDALMPRVESI